MNEKNEAFHEEGPQFYFWSKDKNKLLKEIGSYNLPPLTYGQEKVFISQAIDKGFGISQLAYYFMHLGNFDILHIRKISKQNMHCNLEKYKEYFEDCDELFKKNTVL